MLFHVLAFRTVCLVRARRQRGCLESRQSHCKEDVQAVVGIFALLKIVKPSSVGFWDVFRLCVGTQLQESSFKSKLRWWKYKNWAGRDLEVIQQQLCLCHIWQCCSWRPLEMEMLRQTVFLLYSLTILHFCSVILLVLSAWGAQPHLQLQLAHSEAVCVSCPALPKLCPFQQRLQRSGLFITLIFLLWIPSTPWIKGWS